MRSLRAPIAVSLGGLLLPIIVAGQGIGVRSVSGRPSNVAGAALVYATPVGEFRQNVKQGYGLDGFYLRTASDGAVAFRAEATYVTYGHQSHDIYLNDVFGTYRLTETTDNTILTVGIGPQLMVPSGPLRPYVNAIGGFSYFATGSSIEGLDPNLYDTSTTRASDWKLTYGGGAGFYVGVGSSFALDAGATYYVNGRTTYLTRGDVHEDPVTGAVTFTPRRTQTRFVTYHLGISAAF